MRISLISRLKSLKRPYFIAGVAVGVLYYFVDAIVMGVFLGEGEPWANIIAPSSDDLWMRASIMVILTLFGAVVQGRSRKQQEIEERYARAVAGTNDGIWDWNIENNHFYFSPRWMEILGCAGAELVPVVDTYIDRIHPDDRDRVAKAARVHISDDAPYDLEFRLRHNSGRYVWVHSRGQVTRDEQGKPLFVAGSITEITEQRKAQEALRASARSLARAQRLAHLGGWEWILETGEVDSSDETCNIFGFDPDEITPTLKDYQEAVHPEDRDEVYKAMDAAIKRNQPYSIDHRIIHTSGETRIIHAEAEAEAAFNEEGRTVSLTGTTQDITDFTEIQRAAQESQSRFELLADNLPVLIAYIDSDDYMRFANKTFETWYGLSRDDIIDKPRLVAADKKRNPVQRKRWERVWAGERLEFKEERIFSDKKEVRELDCLMVPHSDGSGKVVGGVLLSIDETERNKAERGLRQAQKMEAVGQLTGGIAHDFNNLLTAVLGSLRLIEQSETLSETGNKCISAAVSAAKRGGELTHRLLAFSRKQTLSPEVLDTGGLIEGMRQLLERTLGEMVVVKMCCADQAWVEVDPGQLENAILNLAINARDAMPKGGTLTIDVSEAALGKGLAAQHEVEPGRYVVISISDVGEGMSKEVVDEAFQPFFTTKEIGKGSGLGLSMVYGFAKQSGGFVSIYSEIDEGTEVRIFLPSTEAGAESCPDESHSGINKDGQLAGLVLVVEDDEDVRTFVVLALQALGLEVLEAEDGPTALKLMDRYDQIDLLLTDVMLPKGMDGGEIGQAFDARFPDGRIIYSSGYSEEAITSRGRLREGIDFLSKPYEVDEMIAMVSRKLGA